MATGQGIEMRMPQQTEELWQGMEELRPHVKIMVDGRHVCLRFMLVGAGRCALDENPRDLSRHDWASGFASSSKASSIHHPSMSVDLWRAQAILGL